MYLSLLQKRKKDYRLELRVFKKLWKMILQTPSLFNLDISLNSDLNNVLDQEELFWSTRSRTQWIFEGDSYTKFFHLSIIIRTKNNKILFLKNDVGEEFFCQSDFENMFTSYFPNIFTSELDSNDSSFSFDESFDCS